MDRIPGGAVTCCTVAAACKGLADRQADHVAVGIMTAGTGVMRICCCTGQRGVRMTGSTVGRSYSHNRCMVRRCRMDGIPGGAVTCRTVAARCKGLANCKTDQVAVAVMTARAVGMRVWCNAQQRIVVTISATRGSNRDDTGVIRNRRMDVTPDGTVTCCTITAARKGLAGSQAGQSTG